MPIVAAANNFLLGIDKQTNEATVSATADYSLPVYDSTIEINEELRRIEVTDAASIVGDPYKGPQSWSASVAFPAYADSLGRFLQAMWPTDTPTGSGPYTHTFSGLGGTQSWVALYSEWPNAGATEFTFGKGQATRIGFSSTAEGGPLRVEFGAVGQAASRDAWSASVADGLVNGYFGLQLAGAVIELDLDTPDVNPSSTPESVRNISLAVNRDITPEPLADAFTITNLGQGKVTFEGSAEFLWNSWDAFNATHFGGASGSQPSETLVYGAMEVTWKHSVQAGWEFRIYVPKVAFRVGTVAPDPAGSPIVLPVTLEIADPASGDHVQPVLINATSAGY